MDDLYRMMARLERLYLLQSQATRLGTVEEVDKGKIRVRMGSKSQAGAGGPTAGAGGGQAGGGTQGQENAEGWLSPWIRTSSHAGWAFTNTPYRKGQTVLVNSVGNLEQATVQPLSFSENMPLDPNAATDAETYRIPKEPEGPAQQDGTPPKVTHQDEDVQGIFKYDEVSFKMGKSGARYILNRQKAVLQFGDNSPRVEITGEKASLIFNDSNYIEISSEGIKLVGATIKENP